MDRPQVGDLLNMHRRPSGAVGELTHDARLREALAAMYAGGSDAQDNHDRAVESLKRDPEGVMVSIVAAYGRCPAGDYPRRQALVQAATVLDHSSALPFLASVALSEIPPEASTDTHSFSTVAEETIIRMAAVEGIAHHGAAGNKHAIELLMRCIESRSFSIRRAAVFGLMTVPGTKRLRARMEALIPKDQHFIFDLKKVGVRDALQVKDPTRHLRQDYKDFDERKPEISGQHSGDRTSPKTK